MEKNMENTHTQFGITLEASASELTQGLGGYRHESCCSKRYDFD